MAFTSGPPPFVGDGEMQRIVDLLWEKLEMIEVELGYLGIEEIHAPPSSPIEGMFVFADGTDWNPGSGRGLYRWSGSSWEKV